MVHSLTRVPCHTVPAMSTVLAPIAATADTVIIPTTTNTVEHSDLPVPESAITVAGNISETPALAANSGTTSSATTANVTAEKPLTEKATETAQQVQARAGDLAQQAQTKAQEVAPQVQDKAKELATKAQEAAPQVQDKVKELATQAQETLGPAGESFVLSVEVKTSAVSSGEKTNPVSYSLNVLAATAGAAVIATAGAAAAGLASLTSSASQAAQDTLIDRAAPVNPVASGPNPLPSTEEKPKSPEATPLGVTGPKSHPTIPSDAAIASLAPSSASTLAPTEGGVVHSTAAAPKYDEHTAVVAKDSAPAVAAGASGAPSTAAAPKYDEHTAVVAKDSTPAVGAGAAHTTAAAPKYDEHTAVVAKDSTPAVGAGAAHKTAAAPKYDEHTAVVAKDSTPVGPSTPIGAGNSAHTTTIPTTPAASTEHHPVEGFIAPKENPEDVHLYHAGAAALGAAVAGAELLGQKLVGVVHPHAVHAKEVGQQSLHDASQTGVSYLEQAKHQAEHLREQAAAEAHRAVQEAEKLAREALHAAQEKAAAAQATVVGAFHHGQEQAQQTAASAQQTVQQTAASTQQTAQQTAASAQRQVQETVASAQQTAQQAAANAQKQVQQTATHVQAVVTGQPAEGAPNKDITPLPASEAPVASRETTSASSGKEAPTVPGAEITSLPASEAPVALQEGSNAMPNEANAVVPAHDTTSSTSTSSARELPNLPTSEITSLPAREAPVASQQGTNAMPSEANAVVPAEGSALSSQATRSANLPASEITPLPVSEAPVAEREVSHAIAGQTQSEPAVAQGSGWAQSQLSNAATTPPIGVTRTSSSYATSSFNQQQQQEALYAAPATVTAVPSSYAAAADLGPSTQQASRDPAVLAAPAAGVRSSSYTVPDRSTYEGGSLSPRASSGAGLPPPVAETKPPLTSTGSSDKALPKAPTAETPSATLSETDTYVAHAGAPSTVPAPSEPSTPSKPDESFSTAPTTPANATVVGRHGGVSEPADSAPSSAPATPSPGGSDSGRDSAKKRGFFSRFLKKDKQ